MKWKEGVYRYGLKREMQPVLKAADKIWKKYGQELVITAALEGDHSPGSLHYYGMALDLRDKYFDPATKLKVYNELCDTLGSDYDCVHHRSHIHVEYDPQ